ncbi:MAG: ribokinase [Planctomycetota bacterium]|jgi:ribokinase
MSRPRVVVVGSSNTDLTVTADRLPRAGETVLGGDLRRAGGGKGANQAVAAARAGAEVAFVGCIGDDEFGRAALQSLRSEGIETGCVALDGTAPSGIALIVVDAEGENIIAVAPGANARLTPAHVRAAGDLVAAADLVLAQLEIPLHSIRAAIETARRAGTPVLLNPAPAPPDGALADLLVGLDYATPNMEEGRRLTGLRSGASPEQVAAAMTARGVGAAFVTLGAEGVCISDGSECMRVRPPAVRAVDTVGAGDCFAGTLAVALAEGRTLREAAEFAVCAAALSVRVAGAQPSLPQRAAIEELRKKHRDLGPVGKQCTESSD